MQFDLIALDADDTLWHNEIYYRQGRETFNRILAKYGFTNPDLADLHRIEIANLEFYGYGAVGFAVSLAEAAVRITSGHITSDDLMRLLAVSKTIIAADVELFKGVEGAVRSLAESHPLMLITKGNELHQASKVRRSGLEKYFDYVEIVADKTPEAYAEILGSVKVRADRFIMVGNAMKSDILPVLTIGGCAVYIHNDLTWSHEHADQTRLPEGKFFELEKMDDLPALIYSLERSS